MVLKFIEKSQEQVEVEITDIKLNLEIYFEKMTKKFEMENKKEWMEKEN